jgi:hypothetical protein
MQFFYRLKVFIFRVVGYEKPLRVAILKYLSLKYKQFRPHYETILLESCIEGKKLGYDEISILELGVAGGNGIIALEKYKNKIQKLINIQINIYGFDSGEGMPITNDKRDVIFLTKPGTYKINKDELEKNNNSKIIYGDIKNTIDLFIKKNPKNIIAIFFDLDFYTSTRDFLKQIVKLENYLCPRVYCYFDDVFNTTHWINEFNGENLAINEFNRTSQNIKIGKSHDNIMDFKFPLAKNNLFMIHNFNHLDYNKYIGNNDEENSLSLTNQKVKTKIF